MSMDVTGCVIATGGSVVYGSAAMEHLKKKGFVVYLEIPFEELGVRLDSERRFARRDGQPLQDMYNERLPLYRRYADITVDCSGKTADDIADEIKQRLADRV